MKKAKFVLSVLLTMVIAGTMIWFAVAVGDDAADELEGALSGWWSHTDGMFAMASPADAIANDAVRFSFNKNGTYRKSYTKRDLLKGNTRVILDEGEFLRSGNTLTLNSKTTGKTTKYECEIKVDYIRGTSKLTLAGGGIVEQYESHLSDEWHMYYNIGRLIFVLCLIFLSKSFLSVYNQYMATKFGFYPSLIIPAVMTFMAVAFNVVGHAFPEWSMNWGLLSFPDLSGVFHAAERYQFIFIVKTLAFLTPFILVLVLRAQKQTENLLHSILNTSVYVLRSLAFSWAVGPALSVPLMDVDVWNFIPGSIVACVLFVIGMYIVTRGSGCPKCNGAMETVYGSDWGGNSTKTYKCASCGYAIKYTWARYL